MEKTNGFAVLLDSSRRAASGPETTATHSPAGDNATDVRLPAPLTLQDLDIVAEAPADTYQSGNSIYTCLAMSVFSIGC